jgi:hypothetical protein
MMSVKHLEDHCAAGAECLETGKGLRRKEPLDGILLAIVIRAEIEAAVCRVEICAGSAKVVVGSENECALVREMVEITSGVGAVCDSNRGMADQELLGLAPAGDGALRGAERHRNGPCTGGTRLNGLQEATGAFGCMRRTKWTRVRGESERIPQFNHLEIAAAQGLDRCNRAVHPLLERQEDVLVGVRDLLGVVPCRDGGYGVNLVLEGDESIVLGRNERGACGCDADLLGRARCGGSHGL